MDSEQTILCLEDLLTDLRRARRNGELGKLAFVTYYAVRRLAQTVGEKQLAERASAIIVELPHAGRVEFLELIDGVISDVNAVWAKRQQMRHHRDAAPAPVVK